MKLTRGQLAVLASVLVLVLVVPFIPSTYQGLLTIALAKSLVVLGVVLLLRADLVSFGHGLYYASGAYAVGLALRNGFPLREAFILVLIGVVSTTLIAALVGLFLSRYRGIFFGMLSTAFTMILWSLLTKVTDVSGGTDGIAVRIDTVFGIETAAATVTLLKYYLVLALAAGSVFVAYRLSHSPLGYLMRAIYDNEIRVEYMGASARRAIYRTYLLAGALGGLGGSLSAIAVGHITPDLAYWTASGEFVFVALLGGTGSVFAPLIGSMVFEYVRLNAFKFSPYTWQMTLGTVLVVIIFFAPGGLWSIFEGLVQRRRKSGVVVAEEKEKEKEKQWAAS